MTAKLDRAAITGETVRWIWDENNEYEIDPRRGFQTNVRTTHVRKIRRVGPPFQGQPAPSVEADSALLVRNSQGEVVDGAKLVTNPENVTQRRLMEERQNRGQSRDLAA